MIEYDETNRGKIWKNVKKDPARPDYKDTMPDFTGELDVDGRKFYVDAWKRAPDANPRAPALNFKIKPKDAPPVVKKADPISTGRPDDLDDLIPF